MSALAQPAASPEEPDFHLHSRSHLRLNRGDHTFDIYLFAPDETAEIVKDSYCGADSGARHFSGRYQLLSVADNSVVSRVDLGPDGSFVENKPHDGARLVRDPKSGQNLIALYQYENCNTESVQFYSVDPSGRLFLISFLDRDGRAWKQILTGPNGTILPTGDGALTFYSYVNSLGFNFCESYTFDGANFLEAAKWLAPLTTGAVSGPNDTGLAERALFEFLSALSAGDYAAAAYYLDTSVNTGGAPHPAADKDRRAAFLEDYCTVRGGQCFIPVELKAPATADQTTGLRFSVSFQNSDFQPFRIGARSSFDFRVSKTAAGFKVLDLPPRIPPAQQ